MKMTADVDEIPTMPSKAINGSFSVIALTLCSKRRYIISSARNLPKILVLCIGIGQEICCCISPLLYTITGVLL